MSDKQVTFQKYIEKLKVQRNDYKEAWDRTEAKAAKDAKAAKEERRDLLSRIDDLDDQVITMKNEKVRARVHQDTSNAGNTSYMSGGTNSFIVQSPTKFSGVKHE